MLFQIITDFINFNAFKSCSSPAIQSLEFPVYFPEPIFGDRPPTPFDVDDDDPLLLALEPSIIDEKKLQFLEIAGEGRDTVTIDEAATFCRLLGFSPSQSDLFSLYKEKGDNISYDDLMKSCRAWYSANKPLDRVEFLERYFKVFSRDTPGILTKAQIRHILTNFGEVLTEDEVDTLYQELEITANDVNISEFIKRVVS